ncbi:AAA family ATPase [Bremerella sp. T1]|uniref:AAA family ATPase n=1 Tax=Bremerella sp. TYQ1 TaxID=3119568 RepID=UPI001CCAE2FF|nr:AAA family ATPase [Bremerella volcania]UBM36739.1 AAA family ATPase [Bremerella volcania]
MYLKAVLVRFFKSFNFDYLRKNHPGAKALPWENVGEAWFPFVRIPLARDITTIVGANESGKSHSLGAIKKGLSGENISRRDFCRYSQFFTVEEGNMRWPDFGLHFADLSREQQDELRTLIEVKSDSSLDEFILIRRDRTSIDIWLKQRDQYVQCDVKDTAAFLKSALLPKVFEIDSSVALPSSVPLSWLRGETRSAWRRTERNSLVGIVDGILSHFSSEEAVKSGASAISKAMAKFSPDDEEAAADGKATRSLELARDLLFKVAKIDRAAIADLSKALAEEDEGLANGLLQQINQRLAAELNFPKWWVQDRDFRLTVSARDDDLVFTISDRTQTEYSFGERSNGLKYFLSYYVQYLAHDHPSDGWEMLLMDEPDAYLSSQGQQDLLRIFDAFAHPEEDGCRPVQVVYVTHSPFLIDRNHGERIRVLEKGTDDEGTRVVNDASKNHYEPLRSSFGSFVGETAFIGNCNLMVEGLADQVLLAGCSTYLRALDVSKINTFDLNRITIVPAGSSSHIPYLVYLARGRDIEQPSVIVLLDSDKSGKQAQKDLKRGGAKGKQIIKPESVLMLADLASEVKLPEGKTLIESEDLIPPGLCAIAVQRFLKKVCGVSATDAAKVTQDAIVSAWTADRQHYDAINHVVQSEVGPEFHIDKMGLAREVVELIHQNHIAPTPIIPEEDAKTFQANFAVLIRRLSEMQRQAERGTSQERISRKVDRVIKSFRSDHPTTAKREEAILLLEDVESALDDSSEADTVRLELQKLRRSFDLNEPKPGAVERFAEFSQALGCVRYSALNAVQQETVDLSAATEPKQAAVVESSAPAQIITDGKGQPISTEATISPGIPPSDKT